MKKGKKNSSVNYFDGEISNGKNKLRFISKLLPNIEKSFNESSSIQLVNCQIKESSYIGQLNQYEILLSTKTQINKSTKKYKLTENHDTKDVQLEIISDLAINFCEYKSDDY